MRKIDKNCNLSTVYKAWEQGLEDRNEAHPKYGNTKTKGLYYLDIVMQLFHLQGGLCAYSEKHLCYHTHFGEEHWRDGKYASPKPNHDYEGHLDHFNPNLKSKDGDITGKKDWLWDNFFMINERINTAVKGEKPVNDILKPDSNDYDPFALLDYDFETHVFKPKKDLEETKAKEVAEMLITLGVNYFNGLRKSYLEEKLKPVLSPLPSKSWDDIEIDQFPTAFAFCKMKIESGEIGFEDLFGKNIVAKDDLH